MHSVVGNVKALMILADLFVEMKYKDQISVGVSVPIATAIQTSNYEKPAHKFNILFNQSILMTFQVHILLC